MLFLGQTENPVLELEHVPVVAAVSFGEHGNVVVAVEAFFEVLPEARVHARILVDGDTAGAVQNPAEYGRFPEAGLGHECRCRNGVPNDVYVQKALVVRDDDIAPFFRDVFGTLDGNFDAEKLEDDVPEGECANFGAVFPVPADTAVKCVRNARNEHDGEDDEVIKESKNGAHCLYLFEVFFKPIQYK